MTWAFNLVTFINKGRVKNIKLTNMIAKHEEKFLRRVFKKTTPFNAISFVLCLLYLLYHNYIIQLHCIFQIEESFESKYFKEAS